MDLLPIRKEPNPSNFAPPFLVQRLSQDTDLNQAMAFFEKWRNDTDVKVKLPTGNVRLYAILPLSTGPAFLSTSFPLPRKSTLEKMHMAGELEQLVEVVEVVLRDLIKGLGVSPCEACGKSEDTTVRISTQTYRDPTQNFLLLNPVVPTCPTKECSVFLAAALKRALQRNPVAANFEHKFVNSCRNCQTPQFKLEEQGKKLLCCSGCRAVWYCGKDCQLEHWKTHKTECSTLKAARENGKLV